MSKSKGRVEERAVKYEVVKMEEGIAGKPPKRPRVLENKLAHPQEEVHYLIVEVLSPSMVRHERVTKFVDYERFGVKEYWILDPEKKKYNFYRNIRGNFREVLPVGADGSVRPIYKCKEIKGFYLIMEWLKSEKYWSERAVNKIIYELIGEEDIVKDISDKTLLDEVIKRMGKKKLKKIIE